MDIVGILLYSVYKCLVSINIFILKYSQVFFIKANIFLFNFSVTIKTNNKNLCDFKTCGANAICRESNKAATCSCLPNYYGNPYEICRPECVVNSDCPLNLICNKIKCEDPCPNCCGLNSVCQVVNHVPICRCKSGYTGDPFFMCTYVESKRTFIN